MSARELDQPHQRFTVGQYRGVDGKLRWTIFHQKPPVDHGNGFLSISVRWPALVASPAMDGQRAALERIASILNANWEQGHA